MIEIKDAFNCIKQEMKNDFDYAWSWHCVISMALQDTQFLNHKDANIAAARIMENLFAVNIENSEYFKAIV